VIEEARLEADLEIVGDFSPFTVCCGAQRDRLS
jgi:hypothetical protein